MIETPSLLHPRVKEVIESRPDKIFELVDAFGAIVHFLFPEIFVENVDRFKRVLAELQLKGHITYACKANKGESFLEACAFSQIGAETSSLYEIRKALAHGIRGEQMTVSGPSKTPECLLLAVQNACMISIDSFQELQLLEQIMHKAKISKASVYIRLNDLVPRQSRFGIRREDLDEVFTFLQGHPEIACLGFSFHLDGYSIEERSRAIEIVLLEIHRARQLGIDCSRMNVGGGFSVNYVSAETWERFQEERGKGGNFYRKKLLETYYPYHNAHAREKHLRAILEFPCAQDTRLSIAQILTQRGIEIEIEPGRALLDQAGFTAIRVMGTKTLKDEDIVLVDGNRNHLSEQWFNSQFLPDPLLLSRNRSSFPGDQPCVASVGGNTCLEDDMLNWKRVRFPERPQRGDILIYPNTAGYQMDSNEGEFLGIPLPPKIALSGSVGDLRWKKDEVFSLLDIS